MTDLMGRLGVIDDVIAGTFKNFDPATTEPVTEPAAPAQAAAPSSGFTDWAVQQKGDRYVWGAGRGGEVDPSAFDCSGLVFAAAQKQGVTVGANGYEQWKQTRGQGELSVEQALRTPGALLFRGDGTGTGRSAITHVAISLGDGRTIEARGSRFGVVIVDAATNAHRFQFGGVIPGLAGIGGTGTPTPQPAVAGKVKDRLAALNDVIHGARPDQVGEQYRSKWQEDSPSYGFGLGAGGSLNGPNVPVAAGTKGEYQAYAQRKLKEAGASDRDVAALIQLWDHESGWNPTAKNPRSTAFGIAQFLDGTWKGVGAAKTADPYAQIDAGVKYVLGRYGSATEAWRFWTQHRWY